MSFVALHLTHAWISRKTTRNILFPFSENAGQHVTFLQLEIYQYSYDEVHFEIDVVKDSYFTSLDVWENRCLELFEFRHKHGYDYSIGTITVVIFADASPAGATMDLILKKECSEVEKDGLNPIIVDDLHWHTVVDTSQNSGEKP